jgi:type I restriction enzyme S subunit
MRAVSPEGGGLTDPEVRPYGEVKKGYTSFLSGDVIMAKITPCMENGKTAVVPNLPHELCFGSTEFHVVRPEADIQPKWIANFLLQHETRRTAQRHMTGAVGQMRVPTSFLENLKIPIAPAKEQQRIVDALDELLSDLDAGVEALRRAQAKLALYRASVLKAAVQGDLSAEWRRQNPNAEPASVLLQRILIERRQRWEQEQLRKFRASGKTPPANWKSKYKEPVAPDTTNLPELPKGWCWASLDQLSSMITSGSRGWKEYYSSQGALFIRSQDIRTDELVIESAARVNPPPNSEGSRTSVEQGDALVTITGANVAKAALVRQDIEESYVSQHVGLIRLVEPNLGDWLHTYLVAPSGGRALLLRASYGAGKPGLSLDNLRELQIPLMPFDECSTLVDSTQDQLSVIEHLNSEVRSKFNRIEGLRQSILRHAFTGQLVPQDPNDEPASELLRRIAEERAASATKKASPRKPATKRKKREK